MWNLFKQTFRNLRNYSFYSFVNIAGLSLSLVASLYIFIWAGNELNVNKGFERGDLIYRVTGERPSNSGSDYGVLFPGPLAPAAKDEIPGIISYCRIESLWNYEYFRSLSSQSVILKQDLEMASVDPSFFEMFGVRILERESSALLEDPGSVILTRSLSKKFFGNEKALGQTIRDNTGKEYIVSAVTEDMPSNSTLTYNMFLPFLPFMDYPPHIDQWDGGDNFEIYFRVKDRRDAEKMIPESVGRVYLNATGISKKIKLQSWEDIYLYEPSGSPAGALKVCRLNLLIGVVILLMACINYVNLSVARSAGRMKEVNIRGMLGATKFRLYMYFLGETAILFLLATAAACILLAVSMPYFNRLTGAEITFTGFPAGTFLAVFLTFISASVIGGIYPAAVLTGKSFFKKMKRNSGRNKILIRRCLMIIQFCASAVLIMMTLVISGQLSFMKNKDLGYDTRNLISMDLPPSVYSQINRVKEELKKNPDILSVTSVSSRVNNIRSKHNLAYGDRLLNVRVLYADETFPETMGLSVTRGEYFTHLAAEDNNAFGMPGFKMPEYFHYVLNETAVRMIGERDIVGKNMKFMRIDGSVKGVVEDFHLEDLKHSIEPLVIIQGRFSRTGVLYVRTNGNNGSVVRFLEETWKSFAPELPFACSFMEKTFRNEYDSEIRNGKLLKLFSFISILISCLGMLGFMIYTTEARKKEIALRRVLGADVKEIVTLLMREFLILAAVALLLGLPVAHYRSSELLKDYAYKIPVSWDFYLYTAAGIFLLIVVSVSFRAVKAAWRNPGDILKADG